MKKYDSYKDSGVEWIGEIPNHWNRIKVKHLVDGSKYYQIGDGDHGSIKPEMYQEDGIPYIRVQNLSWDGSLHKEGLVYLSEEVHSNNLKSKLIPGDLLVCKTGNTIGKIGVLTEEFGESNTTSSVGKISVDGRKYDRNFVKFSFQSEVLQKQIRETGEEKSCQPGFNNNQLTEFFLFSPPLSEQQKIVSFLDNKTSLIDSLIEKTQRKIELLKEKRTSLINEVVTKGLNFNVGMKDSGVEWIGEIPSHWDTKKLKYLSKIIYGVSPPDTTYNDEGVGTLLINGPVEYSKTDFGYTRSLKWTTEPKKFTTKGSLLFCLRGSTTGRMNITHTDVSIGRGVCSINSIENQWFLIYSMFSVRRWIQDQISGSTFPSVTSYDVDNYVICSPPINEQEQIVEYLDEQTGLIDNTISIEEKRIELLKEYRQSLISEVVTGKRKVV